MSQGMSCPRVFGNKLQSLPFRLACFKIKFLRDLASRQSIFNWVLKVIRDDFAFALLYCVIGPENLRNQMQNKNQSRLDRPRFPAL